MLAMKPDVCEMDGNFRLSIGLTLLSRIWTSKSKKVYKITLTCCLSPCQTVTTFLAICGDIRRVITRRISPRISTSCSHTTCLQYFWRNSNRLLRSCASLFDIGTSSTTSVRDSFDIVRDDYVFERVYKSFARSVSSLYDIVRYTTTLVRN